MAQTPPRTRPPASPRPVSRQTAGGAAPTGTEGVGRALGADEATRPMAGVRPLVADGVLALIGNTPLVRLRRVAQGVAPTVLAKMESLNPAGSVKDRIALAMVAAAERDGRLSPGATIVEPTSGNT